MITGTTLAAPISVTDLVITVTSAAGFGTSQTAPQFIKIDDEFMVIAPAYNTAPYNASSLSIPVYRRGDQGTAVAAHNALAPVTTGLFSDQVPLAPGADSAVPVPAAQDHIASYSVNGAIALPTAPNTTVVLTKAGVAAMTLAAPTKDIDGYSLFITSTTAFAHTITATGLIQDGATGAPHNLVTLAAFKGAGITLQALQGLWQVRANNAATVS